MFATCHRGVDSEWLTVVSFDLWLARKASKHTLSPPFDDLALVCFVLCASYPALWGCRVGSLTSSFRIKDLYSYLAPISDPPNRSTMNPMRPPNTVSSGSEANAREVLNPDTHVLRCECVPFISTGPLMIVSDCGRYY